MATWRKALPEAVSSGPQPSCLCVVLLSLFFTGFKSVGGSRAAIITPSIFDDCNLVASGLRFVTFVHWNGSGGLGKHSWQAVHPTSGSLLPNGPFIVRDANASRIVEISPRGEEVLGTIQGFADECTTHQILWRDDSSPSKFQWGVLEPMGCIHSLCQPAAGKYSADMTELGVADGIVGCARLAYNAGFIGAQLDRSLGNATMPCYGAFPYEAFPYEAFVGPSGVISTSQPLSSSEQVCTLTEHWLPLKVPSHSSDFAQQIGFFGSMTDCLRAARANRGRFTAVTYNIETGSCLGLYEYLVGLVHPHWRSSFLFNPAGVVIPEIPGIPLPGGGTSHRRVLLIACCCCGIGIFAAAVCTVLVIVCRRPSPANEVGPLPRGVSSETRQPPLKVGEAMARPRTDIRMEPQNSALTDQQTTIPEIFEISCHLSDLTAASYVPPPIAGMSRAEGISDMRTGLVAPHPFHKVL